MLGVQRVRSLVQKIPHESFATIAPVSFVPPGDRDCLPPLSA